MKSTLLSALSQAYSVLGKQSFSARPLGEGLIHETLVLESEGSKWVLQGFNEAVFQYPERIDRNLSLLSNHAQTHPLPFLLPLPILNNSGNGLTDIGGKKYRLFDFVEGTTLQQINDPQQALIAAKAYGEFADWSKEISGERMSETIPNFHRLDLRYQKLQEVGAGSHSLETEEKEILDFYLGQISLVDWYREQMNRLPVRVTHNDTKINNLIFSLDLQKVEALIDLDTLMGGF